jgi:hypothetical protein
MGTAAQKSSIHRKFGEVAGHDIHPALEILREKPIHTIALSQLRCTQITVGMQQSEHKREKIKELSKRPGELLDYLMKHPIRVVLGPDGHAYVIDHHHLALALINEGYETVPMVVEDDFSGLARGRTPKQAMAKFWAVMEEKKYVHPYDENGKRRAISAIPKKLKDLKDDPYRSLAGFAREAGAFDKIMTPFAEFEWADYFRAHISEKMIRKHFDKALDMAIELAHQAAAKKLPGFTPG